MNCPQCDLLMYQSMCACGFKSPPVTTVEIKKVGVTESNYPLPRDNRTKEILKDIKLTGKEYAAYCLQYMKKVLMEKSC